MSEWDEEIKYCEGGWVYYD